MTSKALKHDGDKPDLALLPYPALVQMAQAFMYGEKKYARHNYRHGFETHRLVGAALRHVYKYESGEDIDPESGVSHLGHALASIAMLITNIAEEKATDTRYQQSNEKVVSEVRDEEKIQRRNECLPVGRRHGYGL